MQHKKIKTIIKTRFKDKNTIKTGNDWGNKAPGGNQAR
jgi:hypothetical protein